MSDIASLNRYASETETELKSILQYWISHTPDQQFGGYIGRIKSDNSPDIKAPKGSVLHSRILWTFSAAFNYSRESTYLDHADRAYRFLVTHLLDSIHGGVYWTVDYQGQPADTKKQIYAQAFAIYALSEYCKSSPLPEVLSAAVNLFELIEKYSFDSLYGGYTDAFSRNWKPVNDLRLSEKDANEKKTMNTHLHLVEAYANLYRVWPDKKLKRCIISLLHIFLDHIIDKQTGHLNLFFDEQWNLKSAIVSYGHDIEAAWLLQEAAELTGEEELIKKIRHVSVMLASAAARGLDNDGGLWYERDGAHLVREKHWWPQAEAMVGFFNAWQLNQDETFFDKSIKTWRFIQSSLLDKPAGEWHWGVDEKNNLLANQDKAGLWKCPYHNSRACLEIIKRIRDSNL